MIRYRLLLPLLLALVSCERDAAPTPANSVDIADDAPDQESWNTTLAITEGGSARVRLVAGHVRRYLDEMETLLSGGVYVEFFDQSGGLNATLLADSARIDDRTQDMSAFGAVFVDSRRNQTTVETERVYYSKSAGELHSDSFVQIRDDARGRTIRGVGFRSDEALRNYTIYKVTGRVRGE